MKGGRSVDLSREHGSDDRSREHEWGPGAGIMIEKERGARE
jgi:hypothetical protein